MGLRLRVELARWREIVIVRGVEVEGRPHPQSGSDWAWQVDGRGALDRGPKDVPRAAVRVVQETSAGPNYFWFVKGVGPVASWTWHNGTYTETSRD